MIELPEIFLSRMESQLGAEEFSAFCDSYLQPRLRGLRLNVLKQGQIPPGEPVPWCSTGYYYGESRPSKTIAYHAGLFYIQEPSAMCPAEVLCAAPGDRVLDLCAAPGGKSVQIAGFLQGRGLLVSNDASASRSRALVKNLERAGDTNAVVLTEMPQKVAARFPAFFDKILVDAPCSGEGMFRRDPDAVKAYTANKPDACAAVQKEILRHAAVMLRAGGRMVYSTCTFNTAENEDVVAAFLAAHKDFSLLKTERIWPHKAQGEGHFVALLQRHGEAGEGRGEANSTQRNTPSAAPREFSEFCTEFLNDPFHAKNFVQHGINLYAQAEPLELKGLRVARSGWFLGEVKKNRFVPSQALAMGIRKKDARFTADLDTPNAERYLRGESLHYDTPHNSPKPWVLVCRENSPLGWARLVQGRLKNHLPTGWVVSQ
jgi:16S rRNA C967 or C1407 C5-methylase (RsmB/RsmF family)/NOL1/NOP2/fmu family ribosome biogenesis protein